MEENKAKRESYTETEIKYIKIGNTYKKVTIRHTFNDEIDINEYFRKMIIRKLNEEN